MVGKKVMVLVNLKPAKLAGVLSEGMLLCAEDAEGNLALMTPEKQCRQEQRFVNIQSLKILCMVKHNSKRDRLTIAVRSGKRQFK